MPKPLTPERMQELLDGRRSLIAKRTSELEKLLALEAELAEDLRKAKKSKDETASRIDSNEREANGQRQHVLSKINSSRPSTAQSHIASMIYVRDEGSVFSPSYRKLQKRVAQRDRAYKAVHTKVEQLRELISVNSKQAEMMEQKLAKTKKSEG